MAPLEDGPAGQSEAVENAPERQLPSSRLTSDLLVLAGLLLAGIGQGLLVALPGGLDLPPALHAALSPVWPHPGPVLCALVLFALASAAFAFGVARSSPFASPCLDEPVPGPVQRFGAGAWSLAIAGICIALFVLEQTARAYAAWQPPVYLAAVGLAIGAFAVHERRWAPSVRTRRPGCSVGELVCVSGLVALFLGLGTWDAGSWYYSSIGDEYNFREMSLQLAGGEDRNLFSQDGAYGIIPVLSSWISGVQMRLFGVHLVGWKVSTITPVGAALLVFYGFSRRLLGPRTAILALGMMASSHYLLAYAHTGYPNLEPILPMAGALLFFVGASSAGARWRLIAAGLCAGLGWYTFYSSRTVIFILMTLVATCVRPARWWKVSWPVVLGFVLAVAPMAVTDGKEIVSRMLEQAGGASTEAVANRKLLPLWNLGRSALAFNYNTHDGPFLFGSLAEPVTAAFFVLGFGFLLSRISRPASRLLLIWFSLGLAATGVLSKYDYVSTSRLHYLVPAVCIIAAVGVDRALGWLATSFPSGAAVSVPIAAALLVLVTASNLYRWFWVAPRRVQGTADSVLVRIVQTPACQRAPRPPLVVDVGIGGAIGPALDALEEKVSIEFALYSAGSAWIETASGRCVVFRSPHDPEAAGLRAAFEGRWPGWSGVVEADRSGKTNLLAYYPVR